MKHYTQLVREQRYQIYAFRKAGWNQSEVAEELGVNKSTISRELARNSGARGYRPRQAQALSLARRSASHAARITGPEWRRVDTLVRREWSPDQIHCRLRLEHQRPISHEWIYHHLSVDRASGGQLYRCLRCQRQRRKRYGRPTRRGALPGRVGIEARPASVATRRRFGHWEGDTVIGHRQRGALVSLVERKSRYTLLGRIAHRTAPAFRRLTVKLLRPFRPRVRSLTLDNGREAAEHGRIAHALHTRVYFAHPYSSWERGTNENTNGLIRQYFPKQCSLTRATSRRTQHVMHRLNHRPRKCLGYRTPYEVLFHMHTSLIVALPT